MKFVAAVAGLQILIRVLGELAPDCVLELLRVLQRLIRQQVEIWIPTVSSRKQLAPQRVFREFWSRNQAPGSTWLHAKPRTSLHRKGLSAEFLASPVSE